METVLIMCVGGGWIIQKENGHQYGGGKTGRALVRICNENTLSVKNRDALAPELRDLLKY